MIFSHFSESSLIAHLKMYSILLNNKCRNPENIKRFREECVYEIERRHDLHSKKQISSYSWKMGCGEYKNKNP